MRVRATQALVKLALEPAWEARFEPNSYRFRPGRGSQDAIEAILNHIRLKPKSVSEADIKKCFDRISHPALLAKLKSITPITRQIRGWLIADIFEHGEIKAAEAGTPQGGIISPLLSNLVLNKLDQYVEQTLIPAYTRGKRRKTYPPYVALTKVAWQARQAGD